MGVAAVHIDLRSKIISFGYIDKLINCCLMFELSEKLNLERELTLDFRSKNVGP